VLEVRAIAPLELPDWAGAGEVPVLEVLGGAVEDGAGELEEEPVV